MIPIHLKSVVVIGPAKSGKTSFAEYLGRHLNQRVADTSQWLIDVETYRQKRIAEQRGIEYTGFEKDNARQELAALGDAVCFIQPSFLIEQALKRGDIVTGIRRLDELRSLSRNEILVVYVKRPGVDVADNFDIPISMADFVIENDGNLDKLSDSAIKIATIISGP